MHVLSVAGSHDSHCFVVTLHFACGTSQTAAHWSVVIVQSLSPCWHGSHFFDTKLHFDIVVALHVSVHCSSVGNWPGSALSQVGCSTFVQLHWNPAQSSVWNRGAHMNFDGSPALYPPQWNEVLPRTL